MTSARVTRVVSEVLDDQNPEARVTRETLEVLDDPGPSARVTRIILEVLFLEGIMSHDKLHAIASADNHSPSSLSNIDALIDNIKIIDTGMTHVGGAGATTIALYTTSEDSRTILFSLLFHARDNTAGHGAMYKVYARFDRDSGGTVTEKTVSMLVEDEDDASWGIDFNISGDDIEIQVIGDGTNDTVWRLIGTVSENEE